MNYKAKTNKKARRNYKHVEVYCSSHRGGKKKLEAISFSKNRRKSCSIRNYRRIGLDIV